MYREHILHPNLWVRDPTFEVTIPGSTRSRAFGYYSLSPTQLETAVLNRLADLNPDLVFLDHSSWSNIDGITITKQYDATTVGTWETTLHQLKNYIKKRNLYVDKDQIQ